MASRRILPAQRAQFLTLAKQGMPISRAAKKVGISRASGYNIYAASGLPFSGEKQQPANIPTPAWSNDQPPPPPRRPVFLPNYTDHTFQSFTAPLGFDGWTLERTRTALSLHRQGDFLESSTLAMTLLGYGPVMQAMEQRVAPIEALPRYIKFGISGTSKVIGQELTRLYTPGINGLDPSPFLPLPEMIAAAVMKVFMGFSCFQSVLGEEDPDLGIRPVYVRRWPEWAIKYYRYRKTFVAMTTEGPVDIGSDSHFTLVHAKDEPHFFGTVLPLGEEVIDGKFTARARASYTNRYGNPKLVGVMPEGVAVHSEEGDAFFQAMCTLRGPDGFGLIPAKGSVDFKGLDTGQSTTFKDAIDSIRQTIFGIILGSEGTTTLAPGGAYSSPLFANVKRELVHSDVTAIRHAVNSAVVKPYIAFNYAATVESDPDYEQPVFDIPLPDPDRDLRIDSLSKRQTSLMKVLHDERAEGFRITQDRVDQLAKLYDVEPPQLDTATPEAGLITQPTKDTTEANNGQTTEH